MEQTRKWRNSSKRLSNESPLSLLRLSPSYLFNSILVVVYMLEALFAMMKPVQTRLFLFLSNGLAICYLINCTFKKHFLLGGIPRLLAFLLNYSFHLRAYFALHCIPNSHIKAINKDSVRVFRCWMIYCIVSDFFLRSSSSKKNGNDRDWVWCSRPRKAQGILIFCRLFRLKLQDLYSDLCQIPIPTAGRINVDGEIIEVRVIISHNCCIRWVPCGTTVLCLWRNPRRLNVSLCSNGEKSAMSTSSSQTLHCPSSISSEFLLLFW